VSSDQVQMRLFEIRAAQARGKAAEAAANANGGMRTSIPAE
jgi:hypothetical protein